MPTNSMILSVKSLKLSKSGFLIITFSSTVHLGICEQFSLFLSIFKKSNISFVLPNIIPRAIAQIAVSNGLNQSQSINRFLLN